MNFQDLASFSPFPIAEIGEGVSMKDGLLLPFSPTCREYLKRGSVCRDFYKTVTPVSGQDFVKCPFGFTTMVVRANEIHFALTGVIGYPRFGVPEEMKHAKKHPDYRISREGLLKAASALRAVALRTHKLESDTVQQYSMALHEIRKLNRQVKQTAERMCQREKPDDPDSATPDLVKILKTSELMTRQFDVIEILANEELAKLPTKSVVEIYKIFDKCARIYKTSTQKITLDAPYNFHPKVEACDKTFPIIASVLIENAQKYSIPNAEIRVTFRPYGAESVIVSVSNLASFKGSLSNKVFEKGYRGVSDREGSGNGLYVAQLVARQHRTQLNVEAVDAGNGRTKVTFWAYFRART
jgi:hypothetical protein